MKQPNKIHKIEVTTSNKVKSKLRNGKEKSKTKFVESSRQESDGVVTTSKMSSRTRTNKRKSVEVVKTKFKEKGGDKTYRERTRKRHVTRFSDGGYIQHD